MTTEHVVCEVTGAVAEVRLRRPDKRNAISTDMWQAIIDALNELMDDDDVRVLIVRGEGGSFSAGADLQDVRGEDGGESPTYRALAEAGLRAVREFGRPTIAVIDGHCIGAGYLMALACDMRIATPRSTFSLPAVRYGFSVEDVGLRRLVGLIGSSQTNRFLLSGLRFDAVEAARIGLVDVCDEQAFDHGWELAQGVVQGVPEAVADTRRSVRSTADGAVGLRS